MKKNYDFQKEIDLLEGIVLKCRQELRKLPEGHLRIAYIDTYCQYYRISETNPKTEVYLKEADLNLKKDLARKRYLEKVLIVARERLKLLKYAVKLQNTPDLDDLYLSLSPARRKLIEKPFDVDSETYAENWLKVKYETNPYPFGEAEYYSNNRERMRSKTEVIIADTLSKFGIPYKYEKAYLLSTGIRIYPDFTILNKRTRQEFILEHFGLMDNEEYRQKFYEKTELYSVLFKDRFLFTFEEFKKPFRRTYLETLIKEYLL